MTFRVVCDGEEETGGDAISGSSRADDGPVDACVVLDGWMKRRNTPELVVATRGLVALDLDVRTGDRDLHSGHYGGTALNAIHALAEALTALFPRDGRLPEPLRAGVTQPSRGRGRGLARAATRRGGARAGRCTCRSTSTRPRSSTRASSSSRRVDVTGILGGKPGAPEHDARVARVGGGHDPGRAGPGSSGGRGDRGAASSAKRSRPARRSDVEPDLTPPAILPRDTEVLDVARTRSNGVFGRRPLIVRVGGTLPITAALARRGIPTVHGRPRASRQPHALAERADAARDVPARRRGSAETYRAIGARAGASR